MAASFAPGPTLANTKHTWRIVQGETVDFALLNGKREEREVVNDMPKAPEKWSPYHVYFYLDINQRAGAATVPDMGYLATVNSVDTIEAEAFSVHFNARFAISNMSQFAGAGQENQLVDDLTFRGGQQADAIVEDQSDKFYGFSSGLLATTNSNISSATATLLLTAGYGVAGITNGAFISSLFHLNDWVCLTDSSDVLLDTTDSFGQVTANDGAGTITVALNGSITYSNDGIRVYKANNGQRTDAAAGSDLNKGLVGMLEMTTATSVHGVSGGTYAAWTAYQNTAGGRLTPVKRQTAYDTIKNKTGLKVNRELVSQGVDRDAVAQERAGLRYDSATSMTTDGSVQAKGIKKWVLKGCPPGYAFFWNSKVINNWEQKGIDGSPSQKDLLPRQDEAADVGRIDLMRNNICRARGGMAVFSGLTES